MWGRLNGDFHFPFGTSLICKYTCWHRTMNVCIQKPAPSAIYQDIQNPPVAINIIDFIPRAQSLLPPLILPPLLLHTRVSTRASSRSGKSNRVGLLFEGLALQPIELLGRRVDGLPPLSVDFT